LYSAFSPSAHASNNNNEHNKNETQHWKFVLKDSVDPTVINSAILRLEMSLLTEIILHIQYGKDKHKNQPVPIIAYSNTNGFVSGTAWKPTSIVLNTTAKKDELQYYVYGVLKWQMLGATFYTQQKFFKGIAVTRLNLS
jgi:hypothetical protein